MDEKQKNEQQNNEQQLNEDFGSKSPSEDTNFAKDESVRLIQQISEAEKAQSNVKTSIERNTGDNVFRGMLVGGLLLVGLVMLIMAIFSEDKGSMFIGGILFSAFGLFLGWLSRAVKKD